MRLRIKKSEKSIKLFSDSEKRQSLNEFIEIEVKPIANNPYGLMFEYQLPEIVEFVYRIRSDKEKSIAVITALERILPSNDHSESTRGHHFYM
jgi:hypothetical protein